MEEEVACFDILVIPDRVLEALKPIAGLPDSLRSRRDVIKARCRVLANSIASPPQAGADPQSHFGDSMIVAGRPLYRYHLPTAIYSPELAKLTERFSHLAEVKATPERVRQAAVLVSLGAEIYSEEEERENALRDHLDQIFGPADWGTSVNGGAATPAAVWGLAMVLEIKNEKGVGGNPQLQAFFSRLHIVQGSKKDGKFLTSNFPCIILSISSTLFEVSLAVMTQALMVDDVFRADIRGGLYLEHDAITLARALTVIADGLEDLKEYYTKVYSHDADKHADYLYPNPVCQDTLQPPSYGPLTFLEKLPASTVLPDDVADRGQSTADRFEYSMALFRATMPDGTVVMVKFTPSYNAESHRLLAIEGLAPKLLHHTRIAGGWLVIVMEDLDRAQNALTYLDNSPTLRLPRSVYDDVQRALKKLHEKKLVFGDLRIQNIMVQGDGDSVDRIKTYLVDFDWCGIEGEARYPIFMSQLKVYWDAGMLPYEKMLMCHDQELLKVLKGFCDTA
ncbi:hypothetical protein E1B28_011007 [Marasmius oreades]|nr:uncharacterized protein E1B28_011007 [Marasmius oreades]KAG7089312.1 hypothetical protein E1B28_011007 [Marasmius oreades]